MNTHSRTTFDQTLLDRNLTPLVRSDLNVLQVNLGKVCNQTCAHCHVDAGPSRTEAMSEDVAVGCIRFLSSAPSISTLDITGGAPELNPWFRLLAKEGRATNRRVIVRCNLTVIFEPGQENLVHFYKDNQLEITASLPCYLEENVERQRGRGVFEKSIDALRLLNSHGYGTGNPSLLLNLVYNPVGISLPPPQEILEAEYKRELLARFDVTFDRLYTITNMPIARFKRFLQATGQYEAYITMLTSSFSEQAATSVMCKNLISVGWDGQLFDCDFNQMMAMPLRDQDGNILDIRTAQATDLIGKRICTGLHCFGCTAGSGSSCTGALS